MGSVENVDDRVEKSFDFVIFIRGDEKYEVDFELNEWLNMSFSIGVVGSLVGIIER